MHTYSRCVRSHRRNCNLKGLLKVCSILLRPKSSELLGSKTQYCAFCIHCSITQWIVSSCFHVCFCALGPEEVCQAGRRHWTETFPKHPRTPRQSPGCYLEWHGREGVSVISRVAWWWRLCLCTNTRHTQHLLKPQWLVGCAWWCGALSKCQAREQRESSNYFKYHFTFTDTSTPMWSLIN